MTRKQRRLVMIGAALSVLAVAAGLVLYAMRDTIVFFYSPSDIAEKGLVPDQRVRLGGLVEEGSVDRSAGATIQFKVTDTARSVTVSYTGLLPDLFREGQGVVVEGKLDRDGTFVADTVLAKHDETYMPPEVAEALKKQGVWQGDAAKSN